MPEERKDTIFAIEEAPFSSSEESEGHDVRERVIHVGTAMPFPSIPVVMGLQRQLLTRQENDDVFSSELMDGSEGKNTWQDVSRLCIGIRRWLIA